MDMIDLIRTQLSILLLLSAVTKWFGLKEFYRTLYKLKVPASIIIFIGWLVPSLELLIAIGFLFKVTALWSEILLFPLLIAFLWAVYTGQKSGLKCNCFGNMLQEKFGPISYLRLAILAILNVILLFNVEHHKTHVPYLINDLAIALITSLRFLLLLHLFSLQLEYKKRKINDL